MKDMLEVSKLRFQTSLPFLEPNPKKSGQKLACPRRGLEITGNLTVTTGWMSRGLEKLCHYAPPSLCSEKTDTMVQGQWLKS